MDAKKWLLGGMAAAVFFSAAFAGWMTTDDAPLASVKAHVVATVDAAGQHWQAAPLYLLRWTADDDAVRYELRVRDAGGHVSFHQPYAFQNEYILPESLTAGGIPTGLMYETRPLDLDGEPLGPWSHLRSLADDASLLTVHAPVPRSSYHEGNGTDLLYPVYAYTAYPGAVSYEVEVTSREPEAKSANRPSRYRIAHYTSELTDIYDPVPRTGSYWWRVRALDADGRPMTVWSAPQHIELAPEAFTVGVFGDSISHDGG